MTSLAGNWVQIHNIVLRPDQRPETLPAETRAVPLELRVKGWQITGRAEIGQEVRIRTVLGREQTGTLIAVNPEYGHDFGRAIPELLAAGDELVAMMRDTPKEG
ncbi:2-amino-4-oxopentanoate thiolase subunit OrtA [Roseovarius sp. EGI FJ00037]|uniref:2-amino-4-oxopentanoate thiolase subunit OrtA n=1 Tax=Roseovarius salincola TaxID=2978479 RepID=UPI0022A8D01A|nr:2-amino-4-oxopentanoate thiolase subunit OrtA [Roseovarius sp. EGI FJ00037]MCZ0812204.1 2-amino-4-oxopentanoate thiolase subunit OrtA [Roseovarius sp. EGI FJ00037]